ncbi:unnamed protein product [Calypogeia fissa]
MGSGQHARRLLAVLVLALARFVEHRKISLISFSPAIWRQLRRPVPLLLNNANLPRFLGTNSSSRPINHLMVTSVFVEACFISLENDLHLADPPLSDEDFAFFQHALWDEQDAVAFSSGLSMELSQRDDYSESDDQPDTAVGVQSVFRSAGNYGADWWAHVEVGPTFRAPLLIFISMRQRSMRVL